jgi:hypothetical protein
MGKFSKMFAILTVALPSFVFVAKFNNTLPDGAFNSPSTGALITRTFSPMSVDTLLPNPERGWADWTGFDFVNDYDAGSVATAYAKGERLGFCLIDLGAFRERNIDSAYLQKLQNSFDSIRSAGMKCVMNIAYDYNISGNDQNPEQIVNHLAQLKPVFTENIDVIAFVKAGFIGAWGEWYYSKANGTPPASSAKLSVRDALLDTFPSTMKVEFRYPSDIMGWYPTPLSTAQAFSGSAQSRVAFHNDCQLSYNDTGTWKSDSQRTYMETVTNYVPYGGEIAMNCQEPQRRSCDDARADFSRWHQTWIKNSNADGVNYYNSWKAGGCYIELQNMSGYRMQLDSIIHEQTVKKGKNFKVRVNMRNVGYSRLFSPRPLVVTLRNQSTGELLTGSAEDLRFLTPQATSSTEKIVKVAIPSNASTGAYDIYLSVPDIYPGTKNDVRQAIRFANSDDAEKGQSWDAATARFKVGTTVMVQ